MNRTITVRGTGNVSLKPDQTIVSLTLKSLDKDYEKSAQKAAQLLEALRRALAEAGFGENELKTESFSIWAEHEGRPDKNGVYRNVFKGYACSHSMKLEFDFDTERLAAALRAIAGSVADPELNISFAVKDRAAAEEALLRSAAANAGKKAAILADASGVQLGELLCIDYSWGEKPMLSETSCRIEAKAMAARRDMNLDMAPADIRLSDSASFVWEIK